AALTFEVRLVAQVGEDVAVAPDLRERDVLHVARRDWQVAAREDFAGVRDEADGLAGEAALGHRGHVGMRVLSVGRTDRMPAGASARMDGRPHLRGWMREMLVRMGGGGHRSAVRFGA